MVLLLWGSSGKMCHRQPRKNWQRKCYQNTYMMGADFYQNDEINDSVPLFGVGENCYIENAIIDKNCMIGNNVRIIGGKHMPDADYESYSVRDGIIVIKRSYNS